MKGGDTIWTYERRSKKKSGYSKQVVTASKKFMSSTSVKYFDRSNQLLKEAFISDFKKFEVSGKTFWSPSKIEMNNVQTQKKSVLFWKDRKLGAKLSKKKFIKKSLKK